MLTPDHVLVKDEQHLNHKSSQKMEDTEEDISLLSSSPSRSAKGNKQYYFSIVLNCVLLVCIVLLGLRLWTLDKSICHLYYNTDFGEWTVKVYGHRLCCLNIW